MLCCIVPSSSQAGKSGALGHGDTAKRAVGRQVKALAGHAVHAMACGADWMLVAAGWRAPAGKAGRGVGSPRAGRAQPPAQAVGNAPPSPSFQATPGSGFAYREVEPEPASPHAPRQRSSHGGQQADHGTSSTSTRSAGLLPGSVPSTPGLGHTGGSGLAASEAGRSSRGSRLRGRSGREQRQEAEVEERAQGWRGGRRRRGHLHNGSGGFPELPDAAPEAALARRQRWMREPPAIPSPITPPDVDSGAEAEGAGGRRRGSGVPRGVDREMAYLMRRQLKVPNYLSLLCYQLVATRMLAALHFFMPASALPADLPAPDRVLHLKSLGAFPGLLGPLHHAGVLRRSAAAGPGVPQEPLLARPLEGGCCLHGYAHPSLGSSCQSSTQQAEPSYAALLSSI